MGESVTEGTVLEWHVAEGESINEGDTLVEVSTDKIDAEVPAPASGVVTEILAQPDDTVKVGQALARIDPQGAATSDGAGDAPVQEQADESKDTAFVEAGGEGDADIGDQSAPSETSQPGQIETPHADEDASGDGGEPGETIEIAMPEMGESVTEGTILEWHVAEGDSVAEGDTVVEVSTDKIDAEVPAPASGTITKLLAQPDDVVAVGQPLAELAVGEAPAAATTAAQQSAAPAEQAQQAQQPATGGDAHRASPIARRAAAAAGIDLGTVKGSGPGGKVVKADVLAAAESNGAGPAVSAGETKPLRGPAAMLAQAMNESRQMPTATSFRTLPVDTLDAKRKALNNELSARGLKVSFTHLIAWAIVKAAKEWPVMTRTYSEVDGKPHVTVDAGVNLGIAVDVERKDGSRSLLVPCIKGADQMDFAAFHKRYEELIAKTRENKLSADDFQGTNITLTNPGGLGTVASVPRLLAGQGTIVAVGSIAYPPEWAHAPAEKIRMLGISKVTTMTSTYDHRIIQGAESGSFLRRIDQLLQGDDEFYEEVARALGVSERPVTNAHPASASAPPLSGSTPADAPSGAVVQAEPDRELLQAVQAATSLLKAYRTHGHLAAHVNPLADEPKGDPALEPENLNLTPELMSRIPASILRIGVEGETLLEALPRMREAYCGTIAYQIEHLSSHQQRVWLRDMIETGAHRKPLTDEEKRRLLSRLTEVFHFERFLQKTYLGQKMFSIEGLDVVVPMIDELVRTAALSGAEEVVIGMAHRGRLSVLAHNLGRSPESIMAEFEGAKDIHRVKAIAAIPHSGTGDVKYHYGAENLITTESGDEIRIRLYPNPSHLEYVDPVVTGAARASQTEHSGPKLHHDPKSAVPLLLHGDAAFPGQGVVAETLNLQSIEGYSTGGTIHIITNNQVGFTTDPHEGRST
ncbi:MAG TPA: 2-oxo acid dehydrogenase subunit E2, partial [Solirubrobacterales bacterium]